MNRKLLLVSNSTTHGMGYLDHAEEEIKNLLGGMDRVLFVPYALADRDAYAEVAAERFRRMGYHLDSIHEADDPRRAVEAATAIFIGGGNTFRLLNELYHFGLIEVIYRRVNNGMCYIGSSAGSNVACVSIKTTNDMPIMQPPSFDALNLVPFNINPHFLDADPDSTHKGETREKRIEEFLEENNSMVVALREGSMLRIEGNVATLKGISDARLFQRISVPTEHKPGDRMDFLLV